MKRIISFAALLALVLPVSASAWGGVGHTMVNFVGASALPSELPAYFRSPASIAEIATLGPEMDRLKGAGDSWDADNDHGHFLDIGDDFKVAGIISLDNLPPNFDAYDTALRKVGQDPFTEGYVPYTILDGWQQVREDFSYYRVDAYMAVHAATAAGKAFFAKDLALRSALTVRDIGVWGHFVADASQPLHITIHFNGWGDYPNPNNYTKNHIHAFFESTYVSDHAITKNVMALVPAYVPTNPKTLISNTEMLKRIGVYLTASAKRVDPLYKIYAAGGFTKGTPEATKFVDQCLAAGATQYRDWIALAWEDSINNGFSYPTIQVRDVLAGKVPVPTNAVSDL